MGTRDYLGEGYIILVNPTGVSETATLTIRDLPYTAQAVFDYFTGEQVDVVSSDTVQITLGGNGTAVFRLKGPEGTRCTSDLNRDGGINEADVQLMLDVILGETSEEYCADIDGDGFVDVQDLQALVNIVLGSN